MRNYRQIGSTKMSYLGAIGSGKSQGGETSEKQFDYSLIEGLYPDIWDGTFIYGSLSGTTYAIQNAGNMDYQTTNWIPCNENEIYYFIALRQPSILQYSITGLSVNGAVGLTTNSFTYFTVPANIKFMRIYYSDVPDGTLLIERLR